MLMQPSPIAETSRLPSFRFCILLFLFPITGYSSAPTARVTSPLHTDLCSGTFYVAEILTCELYCCCADVLVEAVQLGRAGNRNDPRLLRQQPGKRDLAGRSALSLCDVLQQIDERLIGLPVLRIEARNAV